MNIIRTKAMECSVIPAITYKQKLASGGAGIKLIRLDQEASAVATIDKRTGEAVPYKTYDETLFPQEAFDEAVELTAGLPYSSRGKVTITPSASLEADEVEETPETVTPDMVNSDEYKAIVERYSDENGKMNYTLMNKDFIQFAAKSKVVAEMVGEKALTEDIMQFVIKSRAAFIAGKKDSLSDTETAALIETLDEINPRSAFKELKAHINKLLTKKRK